MIQKTRGIVVHHFRYSETSIIARIYTEDFGMQSFLIPGVKKSRSGMKSAFFQSLTPLDMVIYIKPQGHLQRIREIKMSYVLNDIPYEPRKTSIAIFLSEMILHSLKEQEANPVLFEFLSKSVLYLDQTQGRIADFHLVFLLQLTKYLGFAPQTGFSVSTPYFNLREGGFQSVFEPYNSIDKELSRYLNDLASMTYTDLEVFAMPQKYRIPLLRAVIDFYKTHLEGFSEIKSLAILEMLND
ncbi:MAG: DNA repair protein RecO [Bacteroidales bacterium]|nr:DNA repair protein RecO [Bacteroidales bacterium]